MVLRKCCAPRPVSFIWWPRCHSWFPHQAGAGEFVLQSRTFGYGLRISTPHTKVAKKICISTYFVRPRNTAPQDFPRRNLMKLFFPNQKRQQIALAKNQDGARGDDLPNQHKTGTLDCPRRNFANFAHGRVETLYLLNFQGGTCGGDFQIPERSKIFSRRTFIVGDNWRRRCWAAIARCRIPK